MPRFILIAALVALSSGCTNTMPAGSAEPGSEFTQFDTFSSAEDNFDALRVTDRYQSLLLAGDHEAIEANLEHCLQQAPIGLAEVHCQRKLNITMASINLDLSDALYAWLDDEPDSYIANIWLAAHLDAKAWDIRGNKFVSQTLIEHTDAYRTLQQDAIHYAEVARELRPDLPYAYAMLVQYYGSGNNPRGELGQARFEEALAQHPESYMVRVRRMSRLQPRWGGSYQAIDDVVEASEPYWESNPLLRELAFYPLLARARDLWDGHGVDRNLASARELFEQAFALSPGSPTTLSYMALMHRTNLELEEYINALDKAIQLGGASQDTLNRAWDSAFHSRVPFEQREPYVHLGASHNPDSTRWQYRMGYFLHNHEHHEEALEYLQIALSQQPFHIDAERAYRRSRQAMGDDIPRFNRDHDYLSRYLAFVFPAEHYLEHYRTTLHELLLEQHPDLDPEQLSEALAEAMDHRTLRDGMTAFWEETDLSVDQLNVLTTAFAEIRFCACYYSDSHIEYLLEIAEEDPFYAEFDALATEFGWNLFLQAVNRHFINEGHTL